MAVKDGCGSFTDSNTLLAMKQACAQAMGIDGSYVSYLDCYLFAESYVERQSLSSTFSNKGSNRQLQTESKSFPRVAVISETRVPIPEVLEDDDTAAELDEEAAAQQAYSKLVSRLKLSVESGNFTAILREVSIKVGSTYMANAVVDKTVTVSEMELVYFFITESPSPYSNIDFHEDIILYAG